MGSPASFIVQNPFGPVDPLGLNKKANPLVKPQIPIPPAPPSLPTGDDPAVLEAKKKQREADLKRKGRASTIVTGGAGVTGDAPLSQPQALGS